MMQLARSLMAAIHERLASWLVTDIHHASEDLPTSYAPTWQRNQLKMVAASEGRNSRLVRRKELLARLDSASPAFPDLDSLIGFNAAAYDDSVMKRSTHGKPWVGRRIMGS